MYFLSNSCGICNVFARSWDSSTISWLAGWWRRCELTTNSANCLSCIGSNSSLTTQRMSKRDKMGSERLTFSENVILGSYRPPIGLAAAITAHLAWRDVTRPAFEMDMDCCSMASWMDVRSWSFILSNSSARNWLMLTWMWMIGGRRNKVILITYQLGRLLDQQVPRRPLPKSIPSIRDYDECKRWDRRH